MVTGDEEFLLPIRGCKDPSVGIIGSIGKKLQGQKWMCGAAFSQIDLNGVRLPFSVGAHHHKIQSETPYHSFLRQTSAYLGSFPGDQRSVTGVGREHAAEVALPGWPTQKLVMRR